MAYSSFYGRLAQLVEHPLDVRMVSGSIPLASTIEVPTAPMAVGIFFMNGCIKATPRNCAVLPEIFRHTYNFVLYCAISIDSFHLRSTHGNWIEEG